MSYEYSIGTTLESIATLDSLGISVPNDSFVLHSQEIETSDGGVAGQGWPVCEWHWNIIRKTQRDILRTYCPGKSADIYIKTYDEENEFQIYLGKMIWPGRENFTVNRILDFTIVFRKLVLQETS